MWNLNMTPNWIDMMDTDKKEEFRLDEVRQKFK